jgi:glutathione peroxidase
MNIYDLSVKAQDGSDVSLADYKGKVLLIVNTATGCGFTPQYDELQDIYEEFAEKGLEILDFPCNQFGEQAPGSDEEIHTFCTGRFGITFPQFSKLDVNGENADPLYKWLRDNSKFEGFGKSPAGLAMSGMLKLRDKDYKNNSDIKWNFTKFLISRDGEVLGRFEPTNSMKKLREEIEKAL